MVFYCGTQYDVITDVISKLNAVSIFRHCCIRVSCELLHATSVLFELLCIRDFSFCLDIEDDALKILLTVFIDINVYCAQLHDFS